MFDQEAVKRAIETYGSEILLTPINQLAQEFGENAFNVKYLNAMWDDLKLTRCSTNFAIYLDPILFNSLVKHKYKYAEDHPSERWEYMKCLLRIFQFDPRTRQKGLDIINDQKLGRERPI